MDYSDVDPALIYVYHRIPAGIGNSNTDGHFNPSVLYEISYDDKPNFENPTVQVLQREIGNLIKPNASRRRVYFLNTLNMKSIVRNNVSQNWKITQEMFKQEKQSLC